MSKPVVSIIIPAHNHARYLAQSIESVLDQSYPAIELIVLDDGSTDNTREVLTGYQNRFLWESHANRGQAATLNKGWAMAKGDILGYLSADDRLLPQAVATAVAHLDARPEAVLAYCDFNLIGADAGKIRRVHAPPYCYLDMVTRTVCHPGPGAFFRREAHKAAGGWDAQLRQWPDYAYWLQLGLQGPFIHIPEVLAEFRVHEASQTFTKLAFERAEEPIRILERYYARNAHLPQQIAGAQPQALSSAYLASAQLHLRSARYATATARLLSAGRLHWRNLLTPRAVRLCLHGLLARPVLLFWSKLSRHRFSPDQETGA